MDDHFMFFTGVKFGNILFDQGLQHIIDVKVAIDFSTWGDEPQLGLPAVADTSYEHNSLGMFLFPVLGPAFRGLFSFGLVVQSPLTIHMSHIDPCLI